VSKFSKKQMELMEQEMVADNLQELKLKGSKIDVTVEEILTVASFFEKTIGPSMALHQLPYLASESSFLTGWDFGSDRIEFIHLVHMVIEGRHHNRFGPTEDDLPCLECPVFNDCHLGRAEAARGNIANTEEAMANVDEHIQRTSAKQALLNKGVDLPPEIVQIMQQMLGQTSSNTTTVTLDDEETTSGTSTFYEVKPAITLNGSGKVDD